VFIYRVQGQGARGLWGNTKPTTPSTLLEKITYLSREVGNRERQVMTKRASKGFPCCIDVHGLSAVYSPNRSVVRTALKIGTVDLDGLDFIEYAYVLSLL